MMRSAPKMSELLDSLDANGYTNLRTLDDGCVVGVGALIFTYALYIELDYFSWERRYCYKTYEEAVAACNALTTSDDEPKGSYVAFRKS